MTATRKTNATSRFDAAVIGAGVIGLACAWRLAGEGLAVALIERDHPGAGASGVAAGMLAPVGEAAWGESEALALNLRSRAEWPAFAAELAAASADPGFAELGALHIALDRDEAEALRRRHRLHEEHGLQSEWLTPSRCRELEPGLSPAVAGGLFAPGEAAVDPRALITSLDAACAGAGVTVFVPAEVDELTVTGGAVRGLGAVTGGERVEVAAPVVVIAAGADSGAEWLPDDLRPPVRPLKGEILTLRSLTDGAPCSRIVAGERFYAVPRADGRLIVGATMEDRGFDSTVTAGGVHELLRESYRALPDVAELEFVRADARLRPASPDNAPIVGASPLSGLIYATGHFRNGILQTPLTAAAVAAIALGRDPAPEVAPLGPGRFGLGPGSGAKRPDAVQAGEA